MVKNFDIAIIGGSFAGMASALALAKISTDIKIAIIEKQDIKNQDRKKDGKGYAISNETLALFKEIEIFDKVVKNAGVIEDIKITDYKSPVFVNFLSKDVEQENFGALIESHVVHNCLRDKVLQQKNITLFCKNSYKNIDFSEKSAEILLENGEIINAKLLLACDGRISALREKFNIHTTKKDYGQKAIVFNIKHEKPHENVAWEKFLPGGPLAILPLKDQNKSSIVWIAKNDLAETIFSLDEQNFIHQLEKKLEGALGQVISVQDKFSHPLIMVEAQKFYHEKMLLVGDAACGVHPIAGQGLNLGLKSVKILQELIAKRYNSGLDIASQDLIEEYNKKAKFHAKKMVIATDLLNSLFESKSLTISVARDLGLLVVEKAKSLKKFFIKNAGGF